MRPKRCAAALAAALLSLSACSGGGDGFSPSPFTTSPSPFTTDEPTKTPSRGPVAYKPVLYVYSEGRTSLSVNLDYAGSVTYTYPKAGPGNVWRVTAGPDGTLTDASGRSYPYLFWEGIAPRGYGQKEGFAVPGAQATAFLEDKLKRLGLNDKEAADFIAFWGPRLAANNLNLVTFATQQYSADARYIFADGAGNPVVPDTFIRVYMVYSKLDAPVSVPEQKLGPPPERKGLVAVEWGGSEQ